MAHAKTRRSDVVATFHRYIGRNPTTKEDWDTVRYLMTKSPQEVERRLAGSIKRTTAVAKNNATTSEIDPIKIAQKLGYTQNDFSNDPGFIDYWKGKSAAQLEEALKRRGDWNEKLGRKMTPEDINKERDDNMFRDSLIQRGLSENEANVIMDIADNVDTNKILSEDDYKKLETKALWKARGDLKDYYRDVENRDMEDLKNSYADIRNEANRYQQQEAKSYKETLAKTKQSLRARGLTFSGRDRAVLGKEGASKVDNGQAGIAQREIEGELPQARRYNWEDARAGWQQKGRDIGTAAERKYGSNELYRQRDFLQPEGLPDPYNGIQYTNNRTAPIFLPHKNNTQRGFVSRDQADIEKEKELEARKRASDRMRTYKYY